MGKTLTAAIRTVDRATQPRVLRAVDYLRVSTDEQVKGYGISYTGKATRAHIKRKDWGHVATFSDEGEKGTLPWQKRPDAAKLMRLAQQEPRPFDVVVVNETRAIGRKARVFWEWVWKLQDLGVFVAIVDEDIDNTTEDGENRMSEKAQEAFKELGRIRKRTQGGVQEKAMGGLHASGTAPYGWKIKHKGERGRSKLVLDKKVGHKRLHEAWQMIVEQGMVPYAVEDEFNRRGYRGPTKDYWPRGSLRHILTGMAVQKAQRIHRNPASNNGDRGTRLNADGTPMHGDTVVIKLPPMFTKKELKQLNAALKRTAIIARSDDGVYTLSGRLAGACGAHYVGHGRRETRNYRCSGNVTRNRQPGCDCSQIDADAVEAKVWSEVCSLLEAPERLAAMADDWIGRSKAGQVDYDSRIAELEREIERYDDAIAAAVVAAAQQIQAEKAIKKAVDRLTKDRVKSEQMLLEVKAWKAEAESAADRGRDLQDLAEMAKDRLHDMNPVQQAEVLELLDVHVTISGEIQRKTRSDDGLSNWFRERGRMVPHLTEEGWALVAPIFAARKGRPLNNARGVLECVLLKARTGCAWTALPLPKSNMASIWRRWESVGLWEQLMDALVDMPSDPPPAGGVTLPAMKVEGRVDPRLFIQADSVADEDALNKAFTASTIRFQMRLAA